jgi:hypothetical protein
MPRTIPTPSSSFRQFFFSSAALSKGSHNARIYHARVFFIPRLFLPLYTDYIHIFMYRSPSTRNSHLLLHVRLFASRPLCLELVVVVESRYIAKLSSSRLMRSVTYRALTNFRTRAHIFASHLFGFSYVHYSAFIAKQIRNKLFQVLPAATK